MMGESGRTSIAERLYNYPVPGLDAGSVLGCPGPMTFIVR